MVWFVFCPNFSTDLLESKMMEFHLRAYIDRWCIWCWNASLVDSKWYGHCDYRIFNVRDKFKQTSAIAEMERWGVIVFRFIAISSFVVEQCKKSLQYMTIFIDDMCVWLTTTKWCNRLLTKKKSDRILSTSVCACMYQCNLLLLQKKGREKSTNTHTRTASLHMKYVYKLLNNVWGCNKYIAVVVVV